MVIVRDKYNKDCAIKYIYLKYVIRATLIINQLIQLKIYFTWPNCYYSIIKQTSGNYSKLCSTTWICSNDLNKNKYIILVDTTYRKQIYMYLGNCVNDIAGISN